MTAPTTAAEVPDEHELARLERQVDRLQNVLDNLDARFTPKVIDQLPPSAKHDALMDLRDTYQALDGAKTQLASAQAAVARSNRLRAEEDSRRTIDANERMADASKAAAESSADAAKWAKWAAIATAIAAVASLISPFLQRK